MRSYAIQNIDYKALTDKTGVISILTITDISEENDAGHYECNAFVGAKSKSNSTDIRRFSSELTCSVDYRNHPKRANPIFLQALKLHCLKL